MYPERTHESASVDETEWTWRKAKLFIKFEFTVALAHV